jgi:hypothetical protein
MIVNNESYIMWKEPVLDCPHTLLNDMTVALM